MLATGTTPSARRASRAWSFARPAWTSRRATALMAELTGPNGEVVTIEIDDDLTDRARAALRRAGCAHVQVVCGDGAAG
ncbi:hypothetical protein [Nonomuraea angiospora]|uniref:hypothetical protein n=1 Tax=Nonomuraea angiospora TaxID=46172 RepID=UPI0029B65A36|nr:hypothetical protein [Nonomuraea angiospora]MDX3108856.1 hypothetical protein [Nonomuraea angiospora]